MPVKQSSLNNFKITLKQKIMAILKNEPIYPFTEGNYAKPHHIIIAGSEEEIGYELAIARQRKI